jgi:hypothetical protein
MAKQLTSLWTGGKEEEGLCTRCIFPGHTPSDLLLPTRPYLQLFTTSQYAILRVHQEINPWIKSEPSESTHFPEAYQLAIKPPLHKPVETLHIQTIASTFGS